MPITCVSDREEGNQCKFLGVLESVRQEERMSLECSAKKFLHRMSIIGSTPLSEHNRVTQSNQFALPVLGYLMWTQQWSVTELKKLDREARKIIVENCAKHPDGPTAIPYTPREKGGGGGGGGVRSIEEEFKGTKAKAVIKLHRNVDPAMAIVREFEEITEEKSHSLLVKEVAKYAEELGLQLQLEYPLNPTFIKQQRN